VRFLQLPESAWPALARLSGLQVGIWADAWTWQQQGQRAFRTNEQLAQMFGCNERSIRRALKQLTEMGFVEVKRAGQMRFIVAKADQSVHGPNGPRKADQSVRKGGPNGPVREDQSVHQVYQTKSLSTSSVENRFENDDVIYPFEEPEFMEAWNAWKEYKRVEHNFHFKSKQGEQLALVHLKNNTRDATHARQAIGQAMANGWKSIQPSQVRFGNRGTITPNSDEGDAEAIARRDF